MKTVFAGLAAALILAPAAASAQYFDGGYRGERRPHDHVEVYRRGDHEDVVVRHHHPRRYEERRFYEDRRHHPHHDDD